MSVCSVQQADKKTDLGVKRKHGLIDKELRAKMQTLGKVGDCFSHPVSEEWKQGRAEGKVHVLYNKPHSYARKLGISVRVRVVKSFDLILVVRVK